METCENCGRGIGNLETPFVWEDKAVCKPCHTKLSRANGPPPVPASAQPPRPPIIMNPGPVAAPVFRPQPRRGDVVCPNPNCGYVGSPRIESRGSLLFTILLSLLCLFPGFIYWVMSRGHRTYCARCGCQIASQN